MVLLTPTRRVRRTPFSEGVEAAGVTGYTVYNHMLLPSVFRSLEEDYRHLKSAVQVWDVSCERQIEIRGRDAARLVQMLTPRDLAGLQPGRCRYIPVTDERGGMLNDPVALMLAPDRWWISTASSDLLFWFKGIACALDLSVEVDEPDVSPLAVQGPRADALMARVFGEAVRGVPFFRFGWFDFHGRQLAVGRSGFSKQGGFEIYLEGADLGMPLWNALMEAGRDLDVRAGCPNLIERVEGGLLSYGSDMTRANTPLECGLGAFVDDSQLPHCFGGRALAEERAAGSRRMIRAVAIVGHVPRCDRPWPAVVGGERAGQVTSAAWSPDFGETVAIAMIEAAHWAPGTALEIRTHDGPRRGVVRERFWN